MFPEVTFILSLVIVLGMIIYRVDERRLLDDGDEIKNKLPEIKLVGYIRRGINAVIYFVGIRIWRLIRTVRRKLRKKQLTHTSK